MTARAVAPHGNLENAIGLENVPRFVSYRTLQAYPLAVGQAKEPPAPNLQKQPFKDVYMLRQAEARVDKITTDAQGAATGTEPLDVQ